MSLLAVGCIALHTLVKDKSVFVIGCDAGRIGREPSYGGITFSTINKMISSGSLVLPSAIVCPTSMLDIGEGDKLDCYRLLRFDAALRVDAILLTDKRLA